MLFYRSQFFGISLHRGGLIAVCAMFLMSIFFLFSHYRAELNYAINFVLSTNIGVAFLLFCGGLLYLLAILMPLIFMPKEKFFALTPHIKNFTLIFTIFCIFWSLYKGMFAPIFVKKITLQIPKLTVPLKILQITDMHISSLSTQQSISQLISVANAQNADAIVLTGDIIDSQSSLIRDKIALLQDLRAPHGVFFVLGNHEFYHDTHAILDALKSLGITILNNTSTAIKIHQKPVLNIAGITDLSGRGSLAPDPKKAILSGFADVPTILLSHQPRITHALTTLNAHYHIDLVVSGHTHGGQIFPFNFLVPLQQPFVRGLHTFMTDESGQKRQIFVSKGAGTWGPPMRLLNDAEIVLFTLLPPENPPKNAKKNP